MNSFWKTGNIFKNIFISSYEMVTVGQRTYLLAVKAILVFIRCYFIENLKTAVFLKNAKMALQKKYKLILNKIFLSIEKGLYICNTSKNNYFAFSRK
jgi:hypothetical protein